MTAAVRKPRHRLLLVSAGMLSVMAVLLVVHRDEARAVWKSLTGVPVSALAVVLLLVLCQLGFQAFRLWAIVPRGVALTLRQAAYAFTVGEWFNIFTPARAGDALKVMLMHRAPGVAPPSLPRATGTVLADKIVDAGSLVLLCVAAGLGALIRAGAQARLPRPEVIVSAGAVVALLVVAIRRARPRWLERLTLLRREVGKGLAALKDPAKLMAGVSFSLGAWLAELLALRVLCTAMWFPLSPSQLVLALAVLNIGISVPVSVANLGVYEALLALGLGRSGVPLPSAVVIATLHHALQLVGTNLGAAGLSLWGASRRPSRCVSVVVPGEG